MSLVKTATRLIKKKGRPCILRKMKGDPDPARPFGVDLSGPVDTPDIMAVFLDYEEKEFDGVVQRGDMKVLISGGAPVAKMQDQDFLIDGDVEWAIKNIGELAPGNTKYLYTLQVRR